MRTPIDAARSAVAAERESVQAEQEAFATFDRRVADLPTMTTPTDPPVLADPRPADPSLERLRTAYAETVMAVPHYEAEYGDTVAQSLAAEFGEDLAVALVDGSALTPAVHEAVRAATTAARRERESFLSVLEREAESLADCQDALGDVRAALDDVDAAAADCAPPDAAAADDRSRCEFDELHALWSRTVDLESRTDGIGLRRQRTLRGRRGTMPGVPADLTAYLYADLPVSYPGLATIAEVGAEIDRTRRRIERSIAAPD